MGSDDGLTPNMDEHAGEGLVFTDAVAPGPSTLDAMPGTFTGANIPDTETNSGVGRHDRFRHHLRARDSIPERLSRRGYETGAFTANPWTSREFGFDRGFDHFEDFFEADSGEHDEADESDERGEETSRLPPVLRRVMRLVESWRTTSNMFMSWGSFYDDVVEWTERASEPYFLWLFLVDVHMPYLPPDEFRRDTRLSTYASNLWLYLSAPEEPSLESVFRRPLLRAYEDTIAYTDSYFGRLVDDLSGTDPLFVVHADHGEGFGEHGHYGHGPMLYEDNVHVPLFVANGPSGRVEEPFSLTRLPRLLTGLASGEDVTNLTEEVVRSRNHDPKFAVRGRQWKYIEGPDGTELFDLRRGEFEEISDDELEAIGRDLVERWRADERERRRVSAAAAEVAGNHDL